MMLNYSVFIKILYMKYKYCIDYTSVMIKQVYVLSKNIYP